MPRKSRSSPDSVARQVVRLVLDIQEQHVSEAVAVERVRSPQWAFSQEMAEQTAAVSREAMSAGRPCDAYLYARLALEASDIRWGRTRSSPWWSAADALVDAARLCLAAEPDAGRFRLACDVVDQQVALLRADGDVVELAETLFAAGILRVHPHAAVALDIAASLGMRERQETRHWRRDVLIADRRSPEQGECMPPALDCAMEALTYLHEAVDISEGHVKGRCLNAAVEALNLVQAAAPQPDRAAWIDDVKLQYSRDALRLLDPEAEPHARLQMLRVLASHGEAPPVRSLADLFPLPVAGLPGRYGDQHAMAILDQALRLLTERGERDLLRQLIAEVQENVAHSARAVVQRGLWDAQVHVLEGDVLECPAPGGPIEIPKNARPRKVLVSTRRRNGPPRCSTWRRTCTSAVTASGRCSSSSAPKRLGWTMPTLTCRQLSTWLPTSAPMRAPCMRREVRPSLP
ncbi:hypothetical protein [Streptomyces sp. NBC_01443]|uniref:hypothetical protein n=1 Tax=Streptomyces sp. NBC_01443 TaxID=2903868 RepID=UPI00224E92FC|nr:hypothetical protein [Streptomyces sp. NBC_01443]MCX4632762.1 hypothetical protein [Streptomyces sp. NBC_01443]